jgi:diacylglycerol O-acyltransferase / wax synthase
MDAMTPLDSAFLRLENRQAPLHIASIGIFDGPAPSMSEIVELHRSRLDALPRYRQLVQDGT